MDNVTEVESDLVVTPSGEIEGRSRILFRGLPANLWRERFERDRQVAKKLQADGRRVVVDISVFSLMLFLND